MSYLHNHRHNGGVGGFEEAGSAAGDEETLTPHEAYEIERQMTLSSSEPEQEYRSQPHVFQPEEDTSAAIFWTRPKKLIAAISSIALVAGAAAVGVSLSSEQSPSNDQSLIEDVVITDDIGEAPPPIAEDSAEPVAVEPAPELITTEIVEDGIIYDFVSQQEVTVEEPRFDLDVVEFKGDLSDFIDADLARISVDANDENCNSQGALWEFESITDMYPWETSWKLHRREEGSSEKELWVHGPPAKTSYNRLTNYRGKLCLPEGNYEMEIFDSEGDGSCCMYGYGGYLIKVGGAVVAESNMEEDDPFDKRTHTFEIKREETTTTTTTTATTTTTTTTTTEESTTTTSATTTTAAPEESETETNTQDSTEDPTQSPSSAPSPKPTQAPSSSPSSKPTPVPTSEPTPEPTSEPTNKPTPEVEPSVTADCRSPNMIVRIEILTDRQGAHTGYTFTDGSDVIKERAAGTMVSETKYVDETCVGPGTYQLNMNDTKGNGIRSPGYVAVDVGDEKILHDYTFNEATRSYTIRVGFEPAMTSTERAWLEGQNKRREEFHEANGKKFRPLVWSPEVAQGASDWAGKIVSDGCVLSRESNLAFGELTFAMLTSNEKAPITEPESILTRWYDNKIDRDVPSLVDETVIPGLAFSQLVWYASRHVGCAKQVGQIPNGRYCHVVLCRYATAGNCNVRMRSNQWKGPTLADKSICSPACPAEEGCH